MKPDLYQILGVRRNARAETIHAAYRQRARALHPDAGGDRHAFDQLALAHSILMDSERRRRYDETGEVEPVNPENRNSGPVQIIMGYVTQILMGDEDPLFHDVVAALRNVVSDHKKRAQNGLEKLRRAATRAEEIVARLSNENEEDLLRGMLRWRAQEMAKEISKAEAEARACDVALELLSKYSFQQKIRAAIFTSNPYAAQSTSSTAGSW